MNEPDIILVELTLMAERLRKGHCKAYKAVDVLGDEVPVNDPSACRWSLDGAILLHAKGDPIRKVALERAVLEVAGDKPKHLLDIPGWNDRREGWQVADLVERAAAFRQAQAALYGVPRHA